MQQPRQAQGPVQFLQYAISVFLLKYTIYFLHLYFHRILIFTLRTSNSKFF